MLSRVTVTLASSSAGTSIAPLLYVVVAAGLPPLRKAAAGTFLAGGTPAATTTINTGAIDVPSKTSASVTVTRDNVQAALIDTGYYRASDFTDTWPGKP